FGIDKMPEQINAPTKRDPAQFGFTACKGNSKLFSPSLEEIRSWGHSFDKLMKSPSGRKVFRDFLRSEFSEENILFWLACGGSEKKSIAEAIGRGRPDSYMKIYIIDIVTPRSIAS
ncbi:hypothetical protein DOY81_010102, partial [Sarcophaga bullata]